MTPKPRSIAQQRQFFYFRFKGWLTGARTSIAQFILSKEIDVEERVALIDLSYTLDVLLAKIKERKDALCPDLRE